MAPELWDLVDRAVLWLDAHPARFGHRVQWRIGKIAEEYGEVQQTLIAVAGQNPRKSARSTWDDVADELADVIVAAAVALRTVHNHPEQVLARKLDALALRIPAPPDTDSAGAA
jgi:NTP pyrophosphatase (non-canonical NTP hydrolase)